MTRQRPSNARLAAWEILHRVHSEGAFADLLISQTLTRYRLASTDRALVSELVRGVLRWKIRLEWIIDQLWQNKRQQLDPRLRLLLSLGLYQIIYLDRIPDFAAVDESVKLARLVGNEKWASVANGVLRNYLRQTNAIVFPDVRQEPIKALSIQHSHPGWLIELWLDQLGREETNLLCQANNQPAPLSMRINPLRISFSMFIADLAHQGVASIASALPGFVKAEDLPFDLQKKYLEKGWLTVQDESAGLPNFLFSLGTGDVLFDLCAAPGGKSSHAAERSSDRSTIIAMDVHPHRVHLIRTATTRLGLRSVHLLCADARRAPLAKAEVVLLDAPCSGLGVLRRKPDLRWRRQPKDINHLVSLQRQLLHAAANLVAKRGILIYSTCTLHPAENRVMIEQFLKTHPGFSLQPANKTEAPTAFISTDGFIETWPHRHGMDGSFAAKLIKE